MKRFTETDKWRDPWFRSLPPTEKLVFVFVIENCNNAGFYELDRGGMAFSLGLDLSPIEGALKALTRGLVVEDGWVWVRTFLKHQKNDKLNPDNPAHRQVIALINEQGQRFAKDAEYRAFIAPYKGLLSPIGKGQVKVKGEGVQGEKPPEHLSEKQARDVAFEVFWSDYPRKEKKSKAREAFDKVTADVSELLKALEWQKQSSEWTKDGGQFIPHPTTWLNQKRWEDEQMTPLEAKRGIPGTIDCPFL